MFTRLSKADFTTLEGAWAATPSLMCDKTGTDSALNKQDGRSFFLSVRSKVVNQATTTEYFDYPKCVLDAVNSEWACQMFLPDRALQTDGYARFDQPGIIKGYYVTPYIPGIEIISLSTALDTNNVSGSMSLALGAMVTGILATMF